MKRHSFWTLLDEKDQLKIPQPTDTTKIKIYNEIKVSCGFTLQHYNIQNQALLFSPWYEQSKHRRKQIKGVDRLVENEVGLTGNNGHSATVRTRTGILTVLVLARANNIGALQADNLDVVVGGSPVVGVRNQRKISQTASSTSTENDGGPVTDTRTLSTPDAALLNRDTSVVDVVLRRSLTTLPSEVLVRVDNGAASIGLRLQPSGTVHVLRARVVSTTNGDALVNLGKEARANVILLLVPLTQSLLVRVSAVQLTTTAFETTNSGTRTGLVGGPLGLGHTSGTRVGAEVTILAGLGGLGVGVHHRSPTTLQTVDPIDGDNTITSGDLVTRVDAVLEFLRVGVGLQATTEVFDQIRVITLVRVLDNIALSVLVMGVVTGMGEGQGGSGQS